MTYLDHRLIEQSGLSIFVIQNLNFRHVNPVERRFEYILKFRS